MKRVPVKPIQLTPEQVQAIETAVFTAVIPTLDPHFFLLDVALEKEAGYWYLRIYVEQKEGSISISDCEVISRQLDPVVDALPELKELPYNLEISSPGAFRPLRQPREFEFYVGRPVRVEVQQPAGKGKKKQGKVTPPTVIQAMPEGILQAYNPETRSIVLKSQQDQNVFEVALEASQVVCLNPVIQFPDDDELQDAGQ